MNSFYYPYSKTAYWSGSRRRVEKKVNHLLLPPSVWSPINNLLHLFFGSSA